LTPLSLDVVEVPLRLPEADSYSASRSCRDERRACDRMIRTTVNVGDIVPVKAKRIDPAGGSAEVELKLVGR
jgi:hypothetical protein